MIAARQYNIKWRFPRGNRNRRRFRRSGIRERFVNVYRVYVIYIVTVIYRRINRTARRRRHGLADGINGCTYVIIITAVVLSIVRRRLSRYRGGCRLRKLPSAVTADTARYIQVYTVIFIPRLRYIICGRDPHTGMVDRLSDDRLDRGSYRPVALSQTATSPSSFSELLDDRHSYGCHRSDDMARS